MSSSVESSDPDVTLTGDISERYRSSSMSDKPSVKSAKSGAPDDKLLPLPLSTRGGADGRDVLDQLSSEELSTGFRILLSALNTVPALLSLMSEDESLKLDALVVIGITTISSSEEELDDVLVTSVDEALPPLEADDVLPSVAISVIMMLLSSSEVELESLDEPEVEAIPDVDESELELAAAVVVITWISSSDDEPEVKEGADTSLTQ